MFDLERLNGISAAVLGDLALDIYWYADMKQSELSRETPHYPLPVVREVMSLGAGGNVAANLAALKPGRLSVCGIRGDDWRGEILEEKLKTVGADTAGLITEPGRFTQAYCKPMRMGISDVIYEDPRLDFAAQTDPDKKTEDAILAWLDNIDGNADILCVCDQFRHGVVTDAVLDRLARMKTPLAVDSRSRIGDFRGRGVLKPNEDECRAALRRAGHDIPGTARGMAEQLAEDTGMNVLLTLGSEGSLYVSADGMTCAETGAVSLEGPLDICGAGDTSLSAFASCLAAGASPAEAAEVAACASAVTVKKIGTTGTASREEIRTVFGTRDR